MEQLFNKKLLPTFFACSIIDSVVIGVLESMSAADSEFSTAIEVESLEIYS